MFVIFIFVLPVFRNVQGRNFGITARGGGGGELVLPDQKGVAGVVPDGHFSR